jgi:hypothetical protein
VIVNVRLPVLPSDVAETVAVPVATAVTDPVVLTVAIVVALEVYETERPVSSLPAASRSTTTV